MGFFSLSSFLHNFSFCWYWCLLSTCLEKDDPFGHVKNVTLNNNEVDIYCKKKMKGPEFRFSAKLVIAHDTFFSFTFLSWYNCKTNKVRTVTTQWYPIPIFSAEGPNLLVNLYAVITIFIWWWRWWVSRNCIIELIIYFCILIFGATNRNIRDFWLDNCCWRFKCKCWICSKIFLQTWNTSQNINKSIIINLTNKYLRLTV